MTSKRAGGSAWSALITLQTVPHGQNKLFFPDLA